MAHGGTNFGTTAGANHADPPFNSTGWTHSPYQPVTTSYDYDAPLDERGAPTRKFELFRDVLTEFATGHPDEARHYDDRTPDLPSLPPLLAARTVELTDSAPIPFGPPVDSPVPPAFEDLGLEHGLVRYTFLVPAGRPELPLTVEGLNDRATLWVDGVRTAELERGVAAEPVRVPGGVTVELLVESLGRVNYGPVDSTGKGITIGVRHERQYLHGCRAEPLDLDGLPPLAYGTPGPFTRGTLTLAETGDTYLAVPGGRHGHLWVNGFPLGRYDARGPQRTLYCPQPLLVPGENEILLLELGGAAPRSVDLRATPELG